ncbi:MULTISPECIES: methionyl-tRNA formyltransferase [Thiorhodovibrio]|uniref:methionyl-tRNA formyltransferase n=1 Tax=Thiorhodovibrio TaxID=61593 RepID=UPI00191406D8|nr:MULTISPECIES: methionyl-tRNA formyltransferase [Thiorhodovibrio]MBK5969741.1 methionyl-tRNA formyltransferase [Thiorhodovibrio winogradskyi]WPL13792.1 Methionyl-tRNA formyltransferase [Thiorhodovibrio litoralis]
MSAPKPPLLFAGTPEFARPALDALLAAGYPIASVYTQPDRPAGRGRKLQPSPVKQAALAAGLSVEQPTSFKDPSVIARLRDKQAELMVVIAYGLLLPPAVLDAPTLGCLNIHASLLPRWRGAAPIQRAILAGDSRTGVELMQMDQGLDTGPVFARAETEISASDTGRSLHDRLAALGAELLIDTLPDILAGRIQPQPQPAEGACYARKLAKDEALIDWTQNEVEIGRRIRAFNPWPVAQTRLGDETIRLWAAAPEPLSTAHAPGDILSADKSGILVATGSGALRILELQPPGKRAMSAADFLNARKIHGARFG